jgi:hypothetical protein
MRIEIITFLLQQTLGTMVSRNAALLSACLAIPNVRITDALACAVFGG